VCVYMEKVLRTMKNKCVLPFIGQDYQSKSPCCILEDYNNESLDELVSDHKKGVRSRFCTKCWDQEDAGASSKRLAYNDKYSRHLGLSKRDVKISVIPVGNLCNLHCVMCSPGSSTSWWKKYDSMYAKENVAKQHELTLDIDDSQINRVKNLEHVEFIGGETLKSFSLWKVLSEIQKTTSFSLQTNGTVVLNAAQIDLLRSFDKFNICFSLDGYGKIFEYIRQPAKWEQVRKNVLKYVNDFGQDRLSIFLTVNNLNIMYIDKIMLELFKLLPTKIELNFVTRPVEFNYKNLPKHVGQVAEKRNPGFFKKRKINWSGTKKSLQRTMSNLAKQDEFSGLEFSDHLPEVYQMINDFVKK
jgi:sulfatase maturation enzyme AslB (radical SAM superfamily)